MRAIHALRGKKLNPDGQNFESNRSTTMVFGMFHYKVPNVYIKSLKFFGAARRNSKFSRCARRKTGTPLGELRAGPPVE